MRKAAISKSTVLSPRLIESVVPIILAADSGAGLGIPKGLARFGEKTALQIALENCAGMADPVVVASSRLARLVATGDRPADVTSTARRILIHRRGARGQLGSVLAGLRIVPEAAPFMVYAVDYPLLTPMVVRQLLKGFGARRPHQLIAVPKFRGRAGHPVIFAPELRAELVGADSARAVVYRDPRRVRFVKVRESSVTEDFDTPAAYHRVLAKYMRRLSK